MFSRYTTLVLLGLASALTLLQLRLAWNTEHPRGVDTYLLCYLAVWFMVWRRRQQIRITNCLATSSIGLVGLTWVFWQSTVISGDHPISRFLPLASGISLAVLGVGFSKLKQYWRELLVLGFLVLSKKNALAVLDLSPATAAFSQILLIGSGFSVFQEGTKLILPNGFVDVSHGCSGALSVFLLFTLSFLSIMLFPMSWLRSLIVMGSAIAIAFTVNAVRVAIVAALFDRPDKGAFQYWHEGIGAHLFSILPVMLFYGVFYIFLEQSSAGEAMGEKHST